ncbi:MAG: multidrug efflux SMR transporter [Parasphingorhabdus sp.]|nr:multidrug efflux SMR transporter [Parasphingorhabdus sp.]
MNAWGFLAVAIAFEVAGTSLLKLSDGFTKWGWGIASMACYWVCFGFLAIAITRIPVGVAYAMWSGIGIVAVTIIGWLVFRQSLSAMQVGCIMLILAGAVGLNLTTDVKASSLQMPTAPR